MPATAPYPRRWKALVVLAASLLIISLDNTILNVALPTIREDLGAGSSQLQWIVDSYLLVFAGLLLVAGTLGDRFGRRRMLFGGLVLFGAGSVWAAMAGSANELIAARAFMGIGGAAIMPTTLSILTNIFPADERPKAIAAWASVAGLGVALGPTTGGFLIEHFSWSSVFLVNLPVVVAALIGGAWLIPDSKDPEEPRLDLVGAGLSVAGLGAIVWGLIEAPERGWANPVILGAFAAGAAVAAAFVAWERRCSHPMIDLAVFRNRRFSAANVSVTFVFFSLMGVLFFLTTYLQSVMGHSPLEAGIRMGPVAVGMGAASKASVHLAQRFGTKAMVAAGQVTIAAGLSMFVLAGVDTGYWIVAVALGLLGTGMGMTMSPATEAIMGSLPPAKAGGGPALNDVLREGGGAPRGRGPGRHPG